VTGDTRRSGSLFETASKEQYGDRHGDAGHGVDRVVELAVDADPASSNARAIRAGATAVAAFSAGGNRYRGPATGNTRNTT